MTVFVIGVVIVMMNLKRVITCLSSAKSFRAHCSGFPASDFTTLVHARSCFQQKNPLHTAQRPTDKQLAIRWEFTAVKLRAKLWSEAELRFRSSPAVFTASDRQTDSQTAREDISFRMLLFSVLLSTLVMSLTVSSDILKAWCFLWCFQLSSWCVFRPASRESQSLGGRGRSDIPCCWSSPKTWSKRVSKCSPALISPLNAPVVIAFQKLS